jgi:hypothetical protein
MSDSNVIFHVAVDAGDGEQFGLVVDPSFQEVSIVVGTDGE